MSEEQIKAKAEEYVHENIAKNGMYDTFIAGATYAFAHTYTEAEVLGMIKELQLQFATIAYTSRNPALDILAIDLKKFLTK